MAISVKGDSGDPMVEPNVIPLVDIMLVLLIIFMVVTPLLNRELDVKLPATEATESSAPEASQVVVAVSPEGQLTLNNEPISEADYIPRLTRVLAARRAGDRLLFFTADDRAPYGKVVAALDGAKQAGAEGLGIMTAPP